MNLLFFDVDGTLLEYSKGINTLTPEFRQALRTLRDRGDRYFICTGRSHGSLPQVIRDMEPDGYSLCAGAYVTVGDREIRNVFFPQDTLDFILQRLGQFDTVLYLECGLELYTNQPLPADDDYVRRFGIDPAYLLPLGDSAGLEVNKITVTFRRMADIEAMEDFSDHGITVLVQPSPDSFDITLSHSTKRDGLKAVRQHLDPEHRARLIAFGDNYNDIEMIEYADIGVAMGNGAQDLKRIADLVTLSVEEDGVLHALRQLGIL
ncbi:HAD family hydrolase [Proteiniclasticum sp. QWL-01]|uniref:HAD family hydrolase n=1 Tax=Proteiniclasticum sp. QWL-01 TaxID=3036945 RepID=UPI0024100D23|nr:HAD family hydrolase [Proteiniclasticum sp. QWL-01]WFF72597.1 HAD family hydrolase [Proteiniclasticum sp. QWL-01]